jgi:CubicO group peptidase (beta-lactamase class C family)
VGELNAVLEGVLDDPAFGAVCGDGPGVVVGLVADGELREVAVRGLANIEHRVPITRDTVFHVASVSKQFTAYVVTSLADEGRLGLDDPVAKHLAWFPFADVTVRHLIHHTSGLRDQLMLTFLSGRRLEDVITTDDILTLVRRQKELNFRPGSQFSYSNSGYTLLGSVVEAVTGESLRDFCADRIFGPLGMTSTVFLDDHHDVIPRRADSYYQRPDGEYGRIALSYSNAGPTSLNTTVDDLAAWALHVMTPKVRRLLEVGCTLDDGTRLTYAAGVRAEEYRDNPTLSHSGGDAGYRAHLLVLPDRKVASIVLSNSAEILSQQLARRIIDLVLPEEPDRREPGQLPDGRRPDNADIDGLPGRYLDEDADLVYEVAVVEGELVVRSGTANNLLMRLHADGQFVNEEYRYRLERAPGGIVVHRDQGGGRFCKRLDARWDDATDSGYAGTFRSDELDASVHVDVPASGSPRLRRTGWPAVDLRPLGPGLFLASVPYLGSGDADIVVRYSADRSQLRLGDSRARRVLFTRLD